MTCAEGTLILTKLDTSLVPPEIRYSVRIHTNMNGRLSSTVWSLP